MLCLKSLNHKKYRNNCLGQKTTDKNVNDKIKVKKLMGKNKYFL